MTVDEYTTGRPTRRWFSRALAVAATGALAVSSWAVPVRADAAPPHNSIKLTTSNAPFELVVRGSYETGLYDADATRGLAYDASTRKLFVVEQAGVTVIDARDVDAPNRLYDLGLDGIAVSAGGGTAADARADAVAVRPDGLGVVGVSGPAGEGWLVFFDARSGLSLGAVTLQGRPTAVDIDSSGLRAVVACAPGAGDDGSLAIVDLPRSVAATHQGAVRTVPSGSPSAVTATAHVAWATSQAGLVALDLGEGGLATLAAGDGSLTGTQAVDHFASHGNHYLVTSQVAGGFAVPPSEGSFSIWTTGGELVYNSGSELDQLAAVAEQSYANGAPADSVVDGSGPVVTGRVGADDYLFVGLPGIGGVAVFDVSEPSHPEFVSYLNNRDFAVDPAQDLAGAGDLGPRSLVFIRASASPTGNPLVAVGNERSGTITLIELVPRPSTSQAHFA